MDFYFVWFVCDLRWIYIDAGKRAGRMLSAFICDVFADCCFEQCLLQTKRSSENREIGFQTTFF
ncbi:hypothetical protein NEISICOT_00008 [Neisseria sicca ATCC 29256]|uniref:Uncharacterized protein n=1 Tax=Neisseria sicca ATCC 29256 TaxID=547045 RepID=C6M0I4_NEISI|nr:hypothetical protein NEISICOT_00008 [Neisseria sicca ATCC 29256]